LIYEIDYLKIGSNDPIFFFVPLAEPGPISQDSDFAAGVFVGTGSTPHKDVPARGSHAPPGAVFPLNPAPGYIQPDTLQHTPQRYALSWHILPSGAAAGNPRRSHPRRAARPRTGPAYCRAIGSGSPPEGRLSLFPCRRREHVSAVPSFLPVAHNTTTKIFFKYFET